MGGRHVVTLPMFLEDARFFLLGEALHQLQLLDWFPLLIDGDELQRNAGNKNEASSDLLAGVTIYR